MIAFFSKRIPGTLAIIAIIVVIGSWGWFYRQTNAALQATSHQTEPIAKTGQFGDSFGSVTSLFTGLALVGLVYTTFLQRKQAREQSIDSDINRQALARQSREQFLTARLNAVTAMLEAERFRCELAGSSWKDYAQQEGAAESRRLRQKIDILLCEASLGFDVSDWDNKLERKSLLIYLERLLTECSVRCYDIEMKDAWDLNANFGNYDIELRELNRGIKERQLDLYLKVLSVRNELSRLKEKSKTYQPPENLTPKEQTDHYHTFKSGVSQEILQIAQSFKDAK